MWLVAFRKRLGIIIGKRRKKMFKKTLTSILLILTLGIWMTGCVDKSTGSNSDSTAQTETQTSASTEKENSEVAAGPRVMYVNPEDVCIYHNGPYVDPDDFPYVTITYSDLDNQHETMLHDQCGNSSQEYSTDVPERFTGKIGECQNLYSIGDFSFADTGKAKTDDYQLNMGNEGYIELISYNEAGKVVDVTSFYRNSETGEILEGEGYARGKYLDFQNFTASKSIFAYPVYFSKPYLMPSQFEGMEDY